ncbi:T9SS type A sorting domain-containing protein [Hymenobacter sp. BRD67]|uniref:T9SS type A sorting domain-containing protein n=1 Tax=Hymenobacter sp. BRD67 TaxID=2675877 RepID=UPI0015663792|nr:T9SS type A sorting domain-containing protein [Hymenobacter sp. BRD67]QKG52671.1 T9SS type A sorting domain-containing protein [Hymenobacter sp. BRD67]
MVGTATSPATLKIAYNKNISGTIDVAAGSYFTHNQAKSPAFTFGSLATTSTVEYTTTGTKIPVQATQYGNLTISGSNADRSLNARTLTGPTLLAGNLSIAPGSNLVLGNYDLTILSSGSITTSSATGYVVTNGTGRLRLQVPRAGTSAMGPVVGFPVGSSYTSYTPVSLQQTTSVSDDVFEARVLDGVSTAYNASYSPTGSAVLYQNALKTWLISKEVPANASNVTMTLQWNAGETTADFVPATAHINHYTGGAWDTNTNASEWGVGSTTGPYVVTRSGITSFSPFAVSSRANGVLPVVLTSFTAQRTGSAVRCAWTTASEANSRSFSVERSLDGESFSTLGSVAAAGTSAQAHSYSLFDGQPVPATAYYRLRQTDRDGTETYSPSVAVAGTTTASPGTLAPNPTAGPLDVWAAQVSQAEVLTILGVPVLTQQFSTPTQHTSLDLSSLPTGLYLVRLTTAQGQQVLRVTKY